MDLGILWGKKAQDGCRVSSQVECRVRPLRLSVVHGWEFHFHDNYICFCRLRYCHSPVNDGLTLGLIQLKFSIFQDFKFESYRYKSCQFFRAMTVV